MRLAGAVARVPRPVRRVLKRLPGTSRLRGVGLGRPDGPVPDAGTPRPVVYVPTWLRWDEMRQRPQYLLQAFAAAGHPVYFVDPREPTPRCVDGVRITPSFRGVPGRHVVAYVHFAPAARLLDRFEDVAVVYDVLDDLSIYESDERGVPEAERVATHHRQVVARADVVVVSSEVLADRHRPERPDLLVAPNGVDLHRFRLVPPRRGGPPVVGYHGAIASWFDFELYGAVAAAVAEARFRLVGPVAPDVRGEATRLARLPNVELVGERPPDEIPEIVAGFDVGTVPFRLDEMTRAVSPLKMYEYLATGRGVVATALPACRDVPEVTIADDPTTFAAGIRRLLADGGPEALRRRRAVAEGAGWDRRLAPVLFRLDELGRRRVPGP